MKTPEEIEKLAEISREQLGYTNKYNDGFINGYIQCQQDTKIELSTLQSQADKLVVEFAEWIRKNEYFWVFGGSGWTINGYSHRNDKTLTTTELYELFKQSKTT